MSHALLISFIHRHQLKDEKSTQGKSKSTDGSVELPSYLNRPPFAMEWLATEETHDLVVFPDRKRSSADPLMISLPEKSPRLPISTEPATECKESSGEDAGNYFTEGFSRETKIFFFQFYGKAC